MRSEAEALLVVALGFEQLVEMGLAVDVSMQRGVVPKTGDRGKPIIRRQRCKSSDTLTKRLTKTHLSVILQ